MKVAVYLAGQIHTDWRGELARGLERIDLDVELLSPVTDHTASDAVGVEVLGDQGARFWNDQLGAGGALALGKRLITLHPQELDHALKEVDRAAVAVTRTTDQVADLPRYAFGDVTGPTRNSEPARTVGSAAPDSSLPWGRK